MIPHPEWGNARTGLLGGFLGHLKSYVAGWKRRKLRGVWDFSHVKKLLLHSFSLSDKVIQSGFL
jgi:hypothetical protein